MADRPGEDELLQKVVKEAALRSDTDPQVHAEIEMVHQMMVKMVNEFGWIDDDGHPLIYTAAALAITLHDPMDGHPFF
jgi:hypothetical protein